LLVRDPDQLVPNLKNPPPSSMARQVSLRSVLDVALRNGPISRAELARTTGLSKQTTSEVVRVLEESGWLKVSGQTQGGIGRTATTYEVQAHSALVLGVDLGGTKTHLVVADLSGTTLAEIVEPTDLRGGRFVINQIGDLAEKAARQAGVDFRAIRVGVMGSPGVLQTTGAITAAPNIPGLDELSVTDALRRRVGFDIDIENDVNVAAQGEHWQGCCRNSRTFAFVALGTGVGMGLVSDGQIIRGANGAAGEIAYLPLGGDPFDPRGFKHGTLESAIGSEAILHRYHGLGGRADTVRAMFDKLAEGDTAALTTIDDVARILLLALLAVRAVFDPELIVLGGSIGMRTELVSRTRDLAERYAPGSLRIESSALGSRAAVVGAVGMALTKLYAGLFASGLKDGRFPLPSAPTRPSILEQRL
jgi:predicted NBD/HSP70 family sugar kinase